MKKLLVAITALVLTAIALCADVPVSVTTAFNLAISVTPNGALDAPPVWTSTGPGTLQVSADGLGALLVTTTAGTNTITITALAGGHTLTQRVVVTIAAPAPPPATALGISAGPVPK